jgi:putative sugar O-methyltransferase
VGFAFREFLALISNGAIFRKQLLLDGFDKIDLKGLYQVGNDSVPHPKPPLVELEKDRELEGSIYRRIEESYILANELDPDRFDRASWWEEMSRLFRKELFNEKGEINREYLVNFRGIKELPANLVKDQFLVVNRDFGYFLSYLKAIDLVLEYHRHAQIVRKEILCSLSESYAGNNLCVNYRGVRLSLRLLFHSIMVENITSNIAFPTSKRTTIWEIGAGYGGLARILKQYIPNSCHIILDLPETLTYASYFISYNFPNKRVALLSDIRLDRFSEAITKYDFIIVPPWVTPYIPDLAVDLVIDTYSMSEMSKVYAKYYLKHIDRSLKSGGYFYSINKRFKREEDKLPFYEWKFKSSFQTVLYEYSKYIHPQWLGKKV